MIEARDSRKEEPFDKGLVQIYTGNGKGKTTAATGLVVRAVGHGLRVCFIYFIKGDPCYGEPEVLENLPNVTVARFGMLGHVDPNNVTEEEKQQAQRGLEAARKAMLGGEYDIVILDEVNIAVAWKLLPVEDVLSLIEEKPDNVELILTGRYADPRLVEAADLVTEMKEIKHPYQRGILARCGIEY